MGHKGIPVALTLYTVRDEAAKDFLGTLQSVAKMGYVGVELVAENGGLSPRDLRRALDDLGLRCSGWHVALDRLEGDLPRVTEACLAYGTPYVSVPWLPEALRVPEKSAELVQRLNAIGRKLHEQGITLLYHNHDFEFKPSGNRTLLDVIYGDTDPALVKGQPDVFWIAYARHDPAAWITGHPGRCPVVHLKDGFPENKPPFTEVGEGSIDFKPIFAACQASGVEWYVVEQDLCARPSLESAALSLRHLKEWGVA
jgi:sugar phosphate isomerase/epimerase